MEECMKSQRERTSFENILFYNHMGVKHYNMTIMDTYIDHLRTTHRLLISRLHIFVYYVLNKSHKTHSQCNILSR